ncbi:BolA family transcriptional regulator [Exilibacterium tricleocarpae]|uniref:DNA-binding transcriptional regulator BolA n=1 Tax=Exilibacterium tricleocarpae TaxID=2591008 RepID=A0A545SS12_9GAMM|nr:BolA family protein [Exilibacterium tricleocarpae]TQV67758.1 BolA family transcriptional regulator [Exilibacterium tricleocarpae]
MRDPDRGPGVVQARVQAKLGDFFQPSHLQVINESHMHSVPPGSESHFKVVLVAAAFAGQRKVQRHQQVYAVLSEEMQEAIHALALHTYTPEEWRDRTAAPASPQCLGGSKADT